VDEETLFTEALAISSPEQRSAFLKEACGDNVELRQAVEELLKLHFDSESFLNELPTQLEALLSDREPDSGDTDQDQHATDNSVVGIVLPDRYEPLAEIGRGGMGAVWRVRDRGLDRLLAVKLMLPSIAFSEDHRARFEREAQITGRLQHPGIPPVVERGELDNGLAFFSMKLVEGRTLAELLSERSDPLQKLPHFVGIFEQVCQAVAYAHSQGVIHRDLKPANIMVGAFGEVQVMDWGMAKQVEEQSPTAQTSPPSSEASIPRSQSPPPVSDHQSTVIFNRPDEDTDETILGESLEEPGGSTDSHTQAGSVLGTPAYMPPEQARGNIALVDCRADVFSLGAILCTLLTGKPPYTSQDGTGVLKQAAAGELGEAMSRLDDCRADPDLVALCRRCLAVHLDQRPSNAGDVAEAIAAHLADVEERARQSELDRVRLLEQRKRRRVQLSLIASVVGLVVLFGVGFALWALWQQAESARTEANRQRLTAVKERDDAKKARRETERLKEIVERERAKLATVEYGRTMELAQQAWRDNNLATALALLEGTKQELRGWEWHYVNRLCHSDLLTLKGQVKSASFSPDGGRIVTTSDDSAKVWNAKTGDILLVLEEVITPSGFPAFYTPITSASFSPDGSKIVTTSVVDGRKRNVQDWKAKIWDSETGELLRTINLANSVTRERPFASFSPDGARIVTNSKDKTAQVWDAETGTELFTLKGHTDYVTSASFSPDGTRIITASYDRTVKVWDTESGESLLTIKLESIIKYASLPRIFASFGPDGTRIVTASQEKMAQVWDAETGELLLTIHVSSKAKFASFSPDGTRIVTANSDNLTQVWDAETGTELFTLKGHTDYVTFASFSPDGTRIITASPSDGAKLWKAEDPYKQPAIEDPERWTVSASFSPDGTRIVTKSFDGTTVTIFDAESGAELLTLTLPMNDGIRSVSFSPDGKQIVTASLDDRRNVSDRSDAATVWDAETGDKLLTIKERYIDSASFSPDGTRIVTASGSVASPHTAKVWDAITGDRLLTIEVPGIQFASFSPDGTRIVTTGEQAIAKIWDADSGELLLTIGEDLGYVQFHVSFSPDSTRIVSADLSSAFAKVWDAETGTELFTLQGHSAPLMSASFSPGGTRIVTTSSDGTAKIWDAEYGAELLTLKGPLTRIPYEASVSANCASFSPDGMRIVTAISTAKVWDARPVNLRHKLTAIPIVVDTSGAIASTPQTVRIDGPVSWDKVEIPGKMYYTLDGSLPTDGSAEYIKPLQIDKTSLLRVLFIDSTGEGWRASREFIIDPQAQKLDLSDELWVEKSADVPFKKTRIRIFKDTKLAEGKEIYLETKFHDFAFVAFCVRDATHHYDFTISPQFKPGLYMSEGTEYRRLATSSKSTGHEANVWHQIRIARVGSTIKCFVNGEEVLEATDDTYSSGSIGLSVNEEMSFRNIAVIPRQE
jgi:WD40 repeat protein/serine/threonine protein kinase